MENASSSPWVLENVSSTVTPTTTTTRAEGLMRVNSVARRTGGNEENAAPAVPTLISTEMLKQQKFEAATAVNLSPSDVMQEKNATTTKTPILMPVGALRHQLPFRERNMEEGKRVLPPHITVPPKKVFGYPERYRSPTDAMVSPVSRGLLTRNRRPARTLAPVVQALENTFQDVVAERESN